MSIFNFITQVLFVTHRAQYSCCAVASSPSALSTRCTSAASTCARSIAASLPCLDAAVEREGERNMRGKHKKYQGKHRNQRITRHECEDTSCQHEQEIEGTLEIDIEREGANARIPRL